MHNSSSELFEQTPESPTTAKYMKNPLQPSCEAIEQHEANGHLPYRDWCPLCVKAKAQEDPHRVNDGAKCREMQTPTFSADYCFPCGPEPDGKLTVFVGKEHRSRSLTSQVVPRKGGREMNWSSRCLLDFIQELGYSNVPICVKSDQEPSISNVLENVINSRNAQTG